MSVGSFLAFSRKIAALFAVLLLLQTIPAYAFEEDDPLIGCWVYPHDTETAVLTLRADGTALYGETDFMWDHDETGLALTGADGSSVILRCETTDEGMLFWLPACYQRTAGTQGLLGAWAAVGVSNSSWVFATNGQFLEDGVFTGDYSVDEEKGTITLKYVEYFQDTVIDYTFLDDLLVIGYPWLVIRQ